MNPDNNHTASLIKQTIRWPAYLSDGPSLFKSAWDGLQRSDRWPADVVRAGQARQIASLLSWAVEHSPHYRPFRLTAQRLIAAAGDPDRFWTLWLEWPLLTKAELRRSNQEVNSDRLPPGHVLTNTQKTSGSTGIAVEVRNTQVTSELWAALTLREHLWMRRDFSKRLGVIRYRPPNDRPPGGVDIDSWGLPVAALYPTGPASVIYVGLPIDQQAAWLQRFDPHYLLTYPSIAQGLLDFLGDARTPSLQEIRLMSEPLDPELEQQLGARWGVRCTDIYSANEVGNIAFRCGEEGNLHVQSEALLVEILDAQGQACAPGQEGRIVVTSLHNFATPMIRYELGDIALVGEPCPCGRQTSVLARIKGRVRNLVRTPDGHRYWPAGLLPLRAMTAVSQVQYVQTALDTIELRLVLERSLSAEEQAEAAELTRKAFRYPFKIVLREMDALERGPTGKFEEFLSQLPE